MREFAKRIQILLEGDAPRQDPRVPEFPHRRRNWMYVEDGGTRKRAEIASYRGLQ